jgi:predicted ATPase
MLDSFEISNASLDAKVELCSALESTFDTWISVLIGQNGSRKSYFLRQVLEAALEKSSDVESVRRKLDISTFGWEVKRPSSLVCISGTPLDRFPRTRNFSLGVNKKGEGKYFLYLGQRAANGMAGVAQSERALMTALFLNSDQAGARRHIFETVFDGIGFKSKIVMKLKLGKELESRRKAWLRADYNVRYMAKDSIEDYAEKTISDYIQGSPVERHAERLQVVLNEVRQFDFKINGVFTLLSWFSDNDRYPELLFEDGVIRLVTPTWHDWGVDALEVFIRAGLVEVDQTIFFKRNVKSSSAALEASAVGLDVELSGESLSSGQWSWISGFAGLCAHVHDNTLVLVDEPENSLHPLWQQKFLPTLHSVLRGFKGSQAIIVTHSPIVASGVDPEWGRVDSLLDHGVNESGQQVVRSERTTSTFGWKASDVYEEAFRLPSSRAPSFTRTADIALSLIRKGDAIAVDEYVFFKSQLTKDLETLPLTDPLRNVLASIIKDLELRISPPGRR